MISLKGKKLLILGANPVETTIVNRAKELGIYTIATDNNLDHSISPAKDLCDEYWDVSYSDIDKLEELCIKNHIDGIISGFSEIRVEYNIKLCERLGLPCYINMKQLEITRDKLKFKECCRESGVPVIKEFRSIEDVDSFPVIIKPTDRAGSIGVSVATNYKELVHAYNYAMEMSISKNVIIEEYIYKDCANKFDVYYGIIDGEITFLGTDDVLNSEHNGFNKVIQNGWVFPSNYEKQYLKSTDSALRNMIKNMGIKNGYIFFSGFSNNKQEFKFFECGFRLCGGHLYNYFPKLGYYSNMDLFLAYALCGDASSVLDDVRVGKPFKNVTINLYAKAGIIDKITGFEKLKSIPCCSFVLKHARIGQKCDDDKAILSKIGMAYFVSESSDELAHAVEQMYKYIKVVDKNGNNMIFDMVDPEKIRNWWR